MNNIDQLLDQDYEELTEQQKKDLIFRHPVTGLYNRAAFTNVRSHYATPVAMIDMDSLKYINDTVGHHMGDGCICRLGQALADVFGSDHTFHLSGDEFAVLFDGQLYEFKQLMKVVEDKCSVGFSYGFSTGDLKVADLNMLKHKQIRQEQGLRVDRGERPSWFEKVFG